MNCNHSNGVYMDDNKIICAKCHQLFGNYGVNYSFAIQLPLEGAPGTPSLSNFGQAGGHPSNGVLPPPEGTAPPETFPEVKP